LERDRRQWRQGEHVRLVQGSLGPLLAMTVPFGHRLGDRGFKFA
jgi:hypothetical protein